MLVKSMKSSEKTFLYVFLKSKVFCCRNENFFSVFILLKKQPVQLDLSPSQVAFFWLHITLQNLKEKGVFLCENQH